MQGSRAKATGAEKEKKCATMAGVGAGSVNPNRATWQGSACGSGSGEMQR